MANENNGVNVFRRIANMLHVSLETFILIVSVIFVVGFSLIFLKEMFFANPVKEIYMNWDDITYISNRFDEKENTMVVDVVIESLKGFPKTITVLQYEMSQSVACPIITSDSVTVPTMQGSNLILPSHFDSVYGYVKQYHKAKQEE